MELGNFILQLPAQKKKKNAFQRNSLTSSEATEGNCLLSAWHRCKVLCLISYLREQKFCFLENFPHGHFLQEMTHIGDCLRVWVGLS